MVVFILPKYHAGVRSGHEIKFKAFLDGDDHLNSTVSYLHILWNTAN